MHPVFIDCWLSAVFNVKGSTKRTQVPVDMHLELFASNPDISIPIALAWDERGARQRHSILANRLLVEEKKADAPTP